MSDRSRWFVTTEWLASHLGDPSVAILDASWYLPTVARDPAAEYRDKHIPGAVFFDIDGIADKTSTLPHMLPTAPDFARAVGALGVGDGMKVVVYDATGLSSAPRVWWTFRVFGARDVLILEGGLPKWIAEGRPLEKGSPRRAARKFTARFDPRMVSDMADVGKRLAAGQGSVIDGRPAARFYGEAPEPRPGVPNGHIPGSLSVPSADFVSADGKLKDDAELAMLFERAGVDLAQPVVTSCGSGIAAATLTLAAEVLGAKEVALYDGAWTEWAGHKGGPIAKGK
jgi:thiosulfate/3-mercaptopyruvate sulfurtransferase